MQRTLIKDTVNNVGGEVLIKGRVEARRDHGKIVFLDVADYTGVIQVISTKIVDVGDCLEITGLVKARPEKLINLKLITGKIELEVKEIKILAKSETYPFDMGKPELDLELPTLLDHRSLTLRHPKVKEIFKTQEEILARFRKKAKEFDCTEIIVPTISASSTEGGAEVFKIKYFEHDAFLTQSPQLYKQIAVPVFERVFTVTKAYRAEPSVTTRHLTEITQMDCEFGYVDFNELLDLLEQMGKALVNIFPSKIPRLKLSEVQQVIFENFGRDSRGEKDLSPQDEIDICRWAVQKFQSDFVTVTHFPTKKRAFYTMPDPENPELSLSYDLLFRGTEMASGSQRINDYTQLMEAIKNRGMDPKNFEMYLMAFKYAMPPEGGFSFGLERLTTNVLKLANIREASMFPRDMERVDIRLNAHEEKKGQE